FVTLKTALLSTMLDILVSLVYPWGIFAFPISDAALATIGEVCFGKIGGRGGAGALPACGAGMGLGTGCGVGGCSGGGAWTCMPSSPNNLGSFMDVRPGKMYCAWAIMCCTVAATVGLS